jgi:hypothetical protein
LWRTSARTQTRGEFCVRRGRAGSRHPGRRRGQWPWPDTEPGAAAHLTTEACPSALATQSCWQSLTKPEQAVARLVAFRPLTIGRRPSLRGRGSSRDLGRVRLRSSLRTSVVMALANCERCRDTAEFSCPGSVRWILLLASPRGPPLVTTIPPRRCSPAVPSCAAAPGPGQGLDALSPVTPSRASARSPGHSVNP